MQTSNRRDVLKAVCLGAAGTGAGTLGGTGIVGGASATVAADDPAEIATVAELRAIRDDLAGDYVLVADIDATGVDRFEPLGNDTEPFTGTLEGGGHVIEGLTVDTETQDPVGLFSIVGALDAETGGVVSNVTLEDADVTGPSRVGGLVGVNGGTLSNVAVGGSVEGEEQVGGLVGVNRGCLFDSTSTCGVNGDSTVGGLVGQNESYVTESSASGDVSGVASVGGLVGTVSDGHVSWSEATGAVTGTGLLSTVIGGLVGSLSGTVSTSTASGAVSGSEDVGTLIGSSFGTVVASSAEAAGDLVGWDTGTVISDPDEHPSLGGNPRTEWWHPTYTGDRIAAAPTVVDGTVYVGTFPGLGGCEPNVYAVDAQTGDRDWEYDTETDGTRTSGNDRRLSYGRESAANVVDGTLYVTVPDRGIVLALDAETGEETWRAEMEWEGGHGGSVTRYGNTVLAKDDEWLYWFDAETGVETQKLRIDDPGLSVTVAAGRVYFVDRNDGLRAANARTGEVMWTADGFTANATRHSSLTVADGTVYGGTSDGTLYAVDATTGGLLWTFEMAANGSVDPPRTTPTVADGTVYVGSRDGILYAVDAVAGELEWDRSTTTATSMHGSPTVVGETLFAGSDDEHLYAVDTETGEVRWTFHARGAIRSPPTVVDGIVYFGSTNGYLYALDAGVDGSSQDSRVLLGTLGHHDDWAQQGTIPEPVANPETDTDDSSSTPDDESDDTDGASNEEETDEEKTDENSDSTATESGGTPTPDEAEEDGSTDGSPGPGITGTLGSILGAGYLLQRWAPSQTTETDHET